MIYDTLGSMLLVLDWDSRDLNRWRDRKIDRALLRALSKSGGDAIRALKVASTRSLRQRKRFKLSFLNGKKTLPLDFPNGKVIDSLVWTMRVSGDPVPASHFPHRQTKKGVSVAINRSKRTFIKSAFIAKLKSKHVGVFTRRGKERLPIDQEFGSRVSDVFKDETMIPTVQARATKVFRSSFERLFALELAKLDR